MPDTLNTYRTLTPYLVVPDADVEMRFLKAAFGATETLCHRNPDGKVMHAELMVGDSLVMLGQSSGEWKPLTPQCRRRRSERHYLVDCVAGHVARAAVRRRSW
jgi:hypothetical protein